MTPKLVLEYGLAIAVGAGALALSVGLAVVVARCLFLYLVAPPVSDDERPAVRKAG